MPDAPIKKLQLKDVREVLLARLHWAVKMQILLFQAGANAKRCCHQLRWFCKSRVKDIELCYDKKMTTVRGGLSIQGQFGNSFLH